MRCMSLVLRGLSQSQRRPDIRHAVHVHEPRPTRDEDVLRILEWLESGAAGEHRRLLRKLLSDVGSGVQDGGVPARWALLVSGVPAVPAAVGNARLTSLEPLCGPSSSGGLCTAVIVAEQSGAAEHERSQSYERVRRVHGAFDTSTSLCSSSSFGNASAVIDYVMHHLQPYHVPLEL